MAVTEQGLLAALSSVPDPHTGKDFVSTRALRNVQISGGDVAFDVELGYPAKRLVPELGRNLVAAAKGVGGGAKVAWAKAQRPPTWPWPWPPRAPAWACSTPTSTAPASP